MQKDRRQPYWPIILIVLGSCWLGAALVIWADGEFVKQEPPTADPQNNFYQRPDWLWQYHRSYRRLQHGVSWAIVAATLGIGGIVACDPSTWSRRGLARPGTRLVLITNALGIMLVVYDLLVGQYGSWSGNPLSYSIQSLLIYQLPGLILGAWTVQWLQRRQRDYPEWKERLARSVGWLWMTEVLLLILYGVLFG